MPALPSIEMHQYTPVETSPEDGISPRRSYRPVDPPLGPRSPLNKHKLSRQNLFDEEPIPLWKKLALPISVLVVVGIALGTTVHYLGTEEFYHIVPWFQKHLLRGAVVYIASFMVFVVLCFPSTAFELIAGYIFGFWYGLLISTAGKLLGSVAAFFIGRYLCRRWVRHYMERGHPIFRAFQSLVRKKQVMIVFLTRIAFFPIAIKNYGLSVLEVSFPIYFAAALITGLPFSILWVFSGHAAQRATDEYYSPHGYHDLQKNKTEVIVVVVGAVSALALLFFVGFYTRKYVMNLAEEETKGQYAGSDKEEKQPSLYATEV